MHFGRKEKKAIMRQRKRLKASQFLLTMTIFGIFSPPLCFEFIDWSLCKNSNISNAMFCNG